MILSGHQPNYLPYPGFFRKIMLSDTFMFVMNIQFEKKSWQNRNQIKSVDGALMLTVPTLTKGRFDQTIKEVLINNDEPWRRKHLQSLRLNYRKAPFFARYADFFDDLYARDWKTLWELDVHVIRFVLAELDIKTPIVFDSDYPLAGHKTDLLVDMCRKTGCGAYLSNKGSQAYVDLETFKAAGLDHLFMNYEAGPYPQQFGPFVPQLSIFDLLFNCGKEKTLEILSNPSYTVKSESLQVLA